MNGGLTDLSVRGIAIDPTDSHILYAATPAGVFQSTTAGADWHEMNGGLLNRDVFAVAVDPHDSNNVYAVVRGSSVYVTRNALGLR
jgi:hypothetical protein